MQPAHSRMDSNNLIVRRALKAWPYVFLTVSIMGLTYIAFASLLR